MAHASPLIATDIEAYLRGHQHKGLLRFLTCGSVDDGKSTLIGRLLYESKMVFEDQLAALERDSRRFGTQGDALDLALLVDGLSAEREQGITIDVAYRFFSTERRKYIVADTPGHEQYTRNMVTGASTADAAVILVDARKGVLTQTRRHSFLAALLGIRHAVVAVNKMDLVGFSQERFQAIEAECRLLAERVGIPEITCVPLSALRGDNVLARSAAMPWYAGPTLMDYLEAVPLEEDRAQRLPLRFPVQWVNRPHLDFRGFAGTVLSGEVRVGDALRALPSGRESRVARIVTRDGDLPLAVAGQAVTLTLADEIDLSRGDLLCHPQAPAQVASRALGTVVWMSEQPLRVGAQYLLKSGGHKTVVAVLAAPRHRVDVNSFAELPAATLGLNEVGLCEVTLNQPLCFDPYGENRETGAFILIDRLSNGTVGAGRWERALAQEGEGALEQGQRWLAGFLAGEGRGLPAEEAARRIFDELRRRGLF